MRCYPTNNSEAGVLLTLRGEYSANPWSRSCCHLLRPFPRGLGSRHPPPALWGGLGEGASSPQGSALGSCHSGTQDIHWTPVESVSKEASWRVRGAVSSQGAWGGRRGETEGRAHQLGHSRLPLACPGPFLPGSHVFSLIGKHLPLWLGV